MIVKNRECFLFNLATFVAARKQGSESNVFKRECFFLAKPELKFSSQNVLFVRGGMVFQPKHNHNHFWVHLEESHFSIVRVPLDDTSNAHSTQWNTENTQIFSSDAPSNADLMWHQMQNVLELMVAVVFVGQRLMGETKWDKGVETASCDFLRFPAVSCSFLRLQTTYFADQGPNLQKSAKVFDKLPFLPFSLSLLALPEFGPSLISSDRALGSPRGATEYENVSKLEIRKKYEKNTKSPIPGWAPKIRKKYRKITKLAIFSPFL